MNRYLMGFSLPHHGSPQKEPRRGPVPPSGPLLFSRRLELCRGGGIRCQGLAVPQVRSEASQQWSIVWPASYGMIFRHQSISQ